MSRYLVFARYWKAGTFKQGVVYTANLSYTSADCDAADIKNGTGNKSGFGLLTSAGYHWQWGNLAFYTFDTVFEESDSTGTHELTIPGHHNLWLSWAIGLGFLINQ